MQTVEAPKEIGSADTIFNQQIPWTFYLERKQPLFLSAAFLRPYTTLLQQVAGVGFTYNLHIYHRGTSLFYKSAEDLQRVNKHFAQIVLDQPTRLQEWISLGVEHGQHFENFVLEPNDYRELSDIERLLEMAENVLMFSANVPFRVLSGVSWLIEEGQGKEEDYGETIKLFDFFRAKSYVQDVNSRIYTHIWNVVASKFPSSEPTLYSALTPVEVRRILAGELTVTEELLRQRETWCAYWNQDSTENLVFSYDQAAFDGVGKEKNASYTKEIRGAVAYRGMVRGIARIVNLPGEMAKVNEGDIIVSVCTNPNLAPALGRCAGIVTDEGGIMCHAAIVAREMKKPCITGTKHATDVIKDGDYIEVDATSGTVRLLPRYEA